MENNTEKENLSIQMKIKLLDNGKMDNFLIDT